MKRLALIVFLTLATLAGTARATTYTVGTTGDPAGACAGTTGCSLRQLIAKVNAAPFPPDRINLPPGTYTLTLGPLVISQSMTIAGSGANVTTVAQTVPANRALSGDRVFDISSASAVVTIASLKATGGTANGANGNFGGDIRSVGNLTVSDAWITNGFACSGGGIGNASGSLSVVRTLVEGNGARCGGADSGGIENFGDPTPPDHPGHLVIDDSTVTGNDARLVGGIFSWNDNSNTLTIRNSTIAGNRSQAEPSGGDRGGGGLGVGQGTEVIQNSIVANNLDINGAVTTHVNCGFVSSGGITSLGHNLDSGSDCHFAGPGDISNANPLLGPLAGNGGPTPTLALGAGSPALDKVPASGAGCSATDQRGIPRPQGAACDIGAFEQIVAPLNTGPPTIGGSAVQGQTLTEGHGAWIYGATGFAYQWLRCNSAGAACAPIGGATNQFYPVAVADIGHRLRVQETATSPFAVSLPASSGPTGVVSPRRLNIPANGSWLFYRHGLTQVVKLFLTASAAKGTTVKLTCTSAKHAARSSKCPFKHKTVRVKKTTRKLQLGKYFSKRLLAKGTRFDVQVTFPSTIGTVSRFTTRDRKNPRRQILCLSPGAKKPRHC